MASLNKVFLMGNLTFDPELRRTPSGMAVADLRLATSRIFTGRDGDRKEETLFIDVTVWDRQAENCCEYLKKGSSVHVEGSLKMDQWEDKTSGEKRSKIKVHADRVQFLDRRGDPIGGGGGSGSGSGSGEEFEPPAVREAPPRRAGGGQGFDSPSTGNGGAGRGFPAPPPAPTSRTPEPAGDDDDIPF